MKFAPSILSRLFIHADIVSRPMTSILAHSEYVHFLSDWAQLFDKLKRALTCEVDVLFLPPTDCFYCFYVIESWASLFDKLLCAFTNFDLSCTFQLNIEWLMLHKPHVALSS